eukprot:XP_001703342.1 predicted protein [Chlamydomonas reinhardtii]
MDALPSSQARYINQDPIHALRNEFYGQSGAPDAGRGPAKGVVVFSYAPEEVLRQAKLEAMEIKIRRKMLEQKAAQGDSHALRELTEGPVVDIAKLAELGCGGKHAGGRDQVKALVVPPELTEHGEERLDAATSARKKQGGSPMRGVPGRRKERRPVDPLKKQLRDGMLTYVPVKFEKPEGVGRAALVTQAQALSEARHEYDAGFGMPRQTYQPPDPESRRAIQSRPGSAVGTAKTNNRIRGPARSPSHLAASYSGPVASLPPAGHWAGRPDPESVRRSLVKSGATHVYDPEVQPTPVDNYMNSLVGLD